jgi:hypothetical protein
LNLLALDDEAAVRAAGAGGTGGVPGGGRDYQAGKTAAMGRLIGETIKRTGGRAKPDQVRRSLEAELSGAAVD